MEQVSSKETCSRAAVVAPNHSTRNTKTHGCFQLSCLQCVLIRLHPIQNITLRIITANFNIILSCTLISPRCHRLVMFLE